MKKYFLILFLILFSNNALAEIKDKIIQNLSDTNNFSFDFEQNINGKIENGNCKVKYPKKIYCNYDTSNQKILVSNGKSLVIKTISSYYRYPLKKTPLDLILDKNFLINKIYSLEENIIDNSYIKYIINENDNKIDIFFDIISLELIGWQTTDIYQNTALTLLGPILKNQDIKKKLFKLPIQN